MALVPHAHPLYEAAEIPSRRAGVEQLTSLISDIQRIPAPHPHPTQQRSTNQRSGAQNKQATQTPSNVDDNPRPSRRQRNRNNKRNGVGEGPANVPPNLANARPGWQAGAQPPGAPSRPQMRTRNSRAVGNDTIQPPNQPPTNNTNKRWPRRNGNQGAGRSNQLNTTRNNNDPLPINPATGQPISKRSAKRRRARERKAAAAREAQTQQQGAVQHAARVGQSGSQPGPLSQFPPRATPSSNRIPTASNHERHTEQTIRMPAGGHAITHAVAARDTETRQQGAVQNAARAGPSQSTLRPTSSSNPISASSYHGRQTEQAVRVPTTGYTTTHTAARETETRWQAVRGADGVVQPQSQSQSQSQSALRPTLSVNPNPTSSNRVQPTAQTTRIATARHATPPPANNIPRSGLDLPPPVHPPNVPPTNGDDSADDADSVRAVAAYPRPARENVNLVLLAGSQSRARRREYRPRPSASSPCSICLDIPDRFPHHRPTSRCTHASTICAPCLEQHISHAVQSQGSTTLNCPDPECRQTMEYADVMRGARKNKACLDRYEALLLRRTLEREPNFRWCKSSTCNWGQVHESGAAAPIVICQACRARSCFTHDVPWHTSLTCEQYTAQRANRTAEDQASQAYIDRHAKICPNPSCGRRIEKSEGCDHMTCRRPAGCGHEFCWICLADYKRILREGNHRHASSCRYYAAIEARDPLRTFLWDPPARPVRVENNPPPATRPRPTPRPAPAQPATTAPAPAAQSWRSWLLGW